jgi:hypothetical protein
MGKNKVHAVPLSVPGEFREGVNPVSRTVFHSEQYREQDRNKEKTRKEISRKRGRKINLNVSHSSYFSSIPNSVTPTNQPL